ncbi:inorganic phosphate transporter, PiT family [Thermotomaculum hydrothermale]|uniref:Phosphate transporter n=1 Tax=Thermotomaculum hydrothermale TaxID=981385 RepID=A0A7R6PUD7_9BACT|nr:inorganic phosphate transporter [Thermotomaculum hydrothermale]BBB32847.1 inorganic phosphate transporter, PiT family [Thermotomaculum hydrothermale]
MLLFFLSSGLFLGWSLGANDAANVFGTAVGSKMVRFKTAAIIASIFVISGAVISGAGASHTLGKLGAVNALGGSFMTALAAGYSVYLMTKYELPVSTSQAIVGAIVGWNFFSGFVTDYKILSKIISTWVICPILSAIFAAVLYLVMRSIFNNVKIHLLMIDSLTRIGLILVGAFGAYSLGANNIANVMGVFVPSVPFREINLGFFTLSGPQQLFLIGGIAISVGIFTYSYKVMKTVGGELLKLSPQAALVVVLAESMVLFVFASQSLSDFVKSLGLPPIPLVPVSSSQAVVGAIIGIGIVRGWRNIRFQVMGKIALGWVATPIAAGVISFVGLFILQNVFGIVVAKKSVYKVEQEFVQFVSDVEIKGDFSKIEGKEFGSYKKLYNQIFPIVGEKDIAALLTSLCEEIDLELNLGKVKKLYSKGLLTREERDLFLKFKTKKFEYKYQFLMEFCRVQGCKLRNYKELREIYKKVEVYLKLLG